MVDIKDVSENEIVNISTKTTIDEEKKEIMRKKKSRTKKKVKAKFCSI